MVGILDSSKSLFFRIVENDSGDEEKGTIYLVGCINSFNKRG